MTSQGRQYPDEVLDWTQRLDVFAPPSAIPAGALHPVAQITRWHDSSWPRLVRGQRVTAWGREWRVTEASTAPNGDETYQLEPAGVVDARLEAERAVREAP